VSALAHGRGVSNVGSSVGVLNWLVICLLSSTSRHSLHLFLVEFVLFGQLKYLYVFFIVSLVRIFQFFPELFIAFEELSNHIDTFNKSFREQIMRMASSFFRGSSF
jgi:hypothetical protein